MAKGKKTGGRQKGTPNRLTSDIKAMLAKVVGDYTADKQFSDDWKALEPKDRLALTEKFMQYIVPKMQAVAVSGDEDKPLTIEEKLVALSKANSEEE
jgi:hypothetical protein